MSTYYIRTDGSDSNAGTANTSGGAWLTFAHAIATAAAGDVVNVADGTYTEAANFAINKDFAAPFLTFQSISGSNTACILSSAAGANPEMCRIFINTSAQAGGVIFKNIGFSCAATVHTAFFRPYYHVHNMQFVGCKFLVPSGAVCQYGFQSTSTNLFINDNAGDTLVFDTCTFDLTNSTATPSSGFSKAIWLSAVNGASATINLTATSSIKVKNCTVRGAASGFQIERTPYVYIGHNDIYLLTDYGNYGYLVGRDSVTDTPPANEAQGCTVEYCRVWHNNPTLTGTHGANVAKGADGAVVRGNTIFYLGSGFPHVFKGDNIKCYGNTIFEVWNEVGASTNAPVGFYPKGSQNLDMQDCMVYASVGGYGMKAGDNNDSGYGGTPKPLTGLSVKNCLFVAGPGCHILSYQSTADTPSFVADTWIGDRTDPVYGFTAPTDSLLGLNSTANGVYAPYGGSAFWEPQFQAVAGADQTLVMRAQERMLLKAMLENNARNFILGSVSAKRLSDLVGNLDSSHNVPISLTQTVPIANITAKTDQSVGDCLSSARALGAGAAVVNGTTVTVKGPDGSTVRAFTTNNQNSPTSRT